MRSYAGWLSVLAPTLTVLVACAGETALTVEAEVRIDAILGGNGAVRVQHIEQPAGVANRDFVIDCQLLGGQQTGRCSSTFFDVGGRGSMRLRATGIQDTIVSLGGDCEETTGSLCTLNFDTSEPIILQGVFLVRVAAPTDTTSPPDTTTNDVVLADNYEAGCGNWADTVASSAGPVTQSIACRTSGGSDGGMYREIRHSFSGPGQLVVDHTFTGGSVLVGATGDGALCATSVRFRESRIITTGTAMGASFWVMQNGVRYRVGAGTHTSTSWEAVDTGPLTVGDFSPGLDLCPLQPTVLTFGVARSNSTGNPTNLIVGGMDEWSVMVSR